MPGSLIRVFHHKASQLGFPRFSEIWLSCVTETEHRSWSRSWASFTSALARGSPFCGEALDFPTRRRSCLGDSSISSCSGARSWRQIDRSDRSTFHYRVTRSGHRISGLRYTAELGLSYCRCWSERHRVVSTFVH